MIPDQRIPLDKIVPEMIRLIDQKEIYDYVGDAIDLTFSYEIVDCSYKFTLALKSGNLEFEESIDTNADVILKVKANDFHNMTLGKLNFMSIILGKKLKFVKGDLSDMIIIGGLPIDKYYANACKNLEVDYE